VGRDTITVTNSLPAYLFQSTRPAWGATIDAKLFR